MRSPLPTPPATAAAGSALKSPARPAESQRFEPLLLDVEGMKCGGCVRAVEQRLLAQPGVAQASVNLLTRTAWVGLDPAAFPADADAPGALIEALGAMGFRARLRDPDPAPPGRAERAEQRRWWLEWRQLIVALLLLVLSGSGHLAEAGMPGGALHTPIGPVPLGALWFHALVATLALLGPGRPILLRGVLHAWHRTPSMDTLVGLGVGSAYLASLVAFLRPSSGWPCFFNEPVMLLGFVLLGRFLEERARWRTGRSLEQLADLQPDQALLLFADGPARPVRVAGLRPGDRVRLLPGDRVPVDGVVLAGRSAVDASSLTGEPLPIEAVAGTELVAGMLNLQAPLDLEVRRTGSDTALARIIALVAQAQARKAPIQSLADRVSARFCLGVLLLALATFLFWWLWGSRLWPQVLLAGGLPGGFHGGHGMGDAAAATPFGLALQLAIAVLVVACPCALGLATPTAITVGSGLAARSGLLFRGGDAIEAAAGLTAVLFDKTGTLTVGRPLVSAIAVAEEPAAADSAEPGMAVTGTPADLLIRIAAGLEQQTRHPLAHALLQEALCRGVEPAEVSEGRTEPGCGVEGLVAGLEQRCRVGRLDWLRRLGVTVPAQLEARLPELEAQGATLLAVAADQRLLGLVAVQDRARADAGRTLARLGEMGLRLGVLSGDRERAVQSFGAQVALPERSLAWELRPEQKLEHIERWRQDGPVAMVGDGINDAPALAAADLGVAVGTGTQIAQDTADLVILGDRLDGLVEALQLARRTLAKVRQNLAWAFGYNLIVLPIAAGALLPGFGLLLSPPLAAVLMAASSITVVVNALLLHARP